MKHTIPYILLLFPMLLSAQTDLSGLISNANGTIVQSVEVSLLDDQGQLIANQVTTNGQYRFEALPSGYNYTLLFDKAGSALNGLSTFDAVVIARHIIQSEPLTPGPKMLAADLDGNGHISVTDLLHLRNLTLAIITELPNHRNWLFIAEDETPANNAQLNSFTFQINGNEVVKDFLIQKVGDMNDTAEYN